jgi:hypothetical protein
LGDIQGIFGGILREYLGEYSCNIWGEHSGNNWVNTKKILPGILGEDSGRLRE